MSNSACLRRARAFDRHGRLGKERAAGFEPLHQLPGIGGQIVSVIRGHAVAPERLFQPLDLCPVELEPRADDEAVVFNHPATVEDHGIVPGLERGHRGLDPVHALRNEAAHGLGRLGRLEDTAADHGPAGLVVMDFRRVDHRDPQPRHARLEARRHRDTARAAADDYHVEFRVTRIGGRLATIGDASRNSGHVIACGLGGSENFRHRAALGLAQ